MTVREVLVKTCNLLAKKEGTALDLAIVCAILHSDGVIPRNCDLSDKCIIGELSLSGDVRKVRGVLPMTVCAKDSGRREIYVPR